MITSKLTGNTRYRAQIRWFRPPLIVLQVEFHRKGYEMCNQYDLDYGGRDVDVYEWRDAKLEDLKMIVKE
jgi:hypothetical protein